jgi:hypothetical protein
MDVEFNEPEPPDYQEHELDQTRKRITPQQPEQSPTPPVSGRTPGSAEGERDRDEQSR